MVKKAFYAFTVLLALLFIVLGFFRVQASFEFRALEFREEGASLEKYTRLSEIWKLLYKIIPYLCAVHPFFALAVWLTCQGSFKTTAIPTLLAAAVIAALGYSMPYITGHRMGNGNINLFFFFCLLPYFEALAVSLILGKVTHRI